jgi:hypothetical protein
MSDYELKNLRPGQTVVRVLNYGLFCFLLLNFGLLVDLAA